MIIPLHDFQIKSPAEFPRGFFHCCTPSSCPLCANSLHRALPKRY
jgi:hypothetical protein